MGREKNWIRIEEWVGNRTGKEPVKKWKRTGKDLGKKGEERDWEKKEKEAILSLRKADFTVVHQKVAGEGLNGRYARQRVMKKRKEKNRHAFWAEFYAPS